MSDPISDPNSDPNSDPGSEHSPAPAGGRDLAGQDTGGPLAGRDESGAARERAPFASAATPHASPRPDAAERMAAPPAPPIASPPATPTRFQITAEAPVVARQSGGWLWLLVLAALLFAAPIVVRWFLFAGAGTTYVPPATSAPLLAMTPEPTATPWAVGMAPASDNRLITTQPRGPVVIDYAHFNQIDARGMQPLASALSRRGLSTRVWLTDVDPFAISSGSGFPDQSEALAEQLQDASALVVISPYFYWTPQEIAVAERFVADGGRLLLISDPDIFGDSAVYMNLLSETFGVVFNDDYLYDTVRNDENFTHFYQGEFLDEAAALSGLDIAFYGGRSISGDVVPQAISAATTLSSRRTGVNGFTTVAIAASRGWEEGGRVLAMSDFDVLTEPNVVRHDNQQMVEFVADFLSAGERRASIADFPAWLAREVTLMIGSESGLNAETLLVGAQLQRRLEETGRNLTLAGAPFVPTATRAGDSASAANGSGAVPPGARVTATPLPTLPPLATLPPLDGNADATAEAVTEEVADADAGAEKSAPSATALVSEGGTIPLPSPEDALGSALPSGSDVILLADYDYAQGNTRLLQQVGIALEIEYVTPTPGATITLPASSPTPAASATLTATTPVTASVAPDSTPMLPTETPPADATQQSPSDEADDGPGQAPPPAVTPAVTPAETPVETPEPAVTDDAEAAPTAAGSRTEPAADGLPAASATKAPTASATPSPTPSPTPTPIEVQWLVGEDGLRLLADQTVLVLRTDTSFLEKNTATTSAQGNAVVVLGARAAAIHAGVKRLLENDFSDCIVGAEVTYCPIAAETGSATPVRSNGGSAGSSAGSATPSSTGMSTPAPTGTVTAPATPAPSSDEGAVLLIDDNAAAADGENSEADHYLRALTAQGVSPTLWSTDAAGLPASDDLSAFKWVIWSNGGYAAGEVPLDGLDALFTYINAGGRLTVSSAKPFFAMGVEAPSQIVDVAVVDDVVALSKGLYSPVNLVGERHAVAPLAEPDDEASFAVTLVRGSASENPEAPAMVSATDAGEEEEMGAKLIVLAMSVGWLPPAFADVLIANMAEWMLAE